MFKPRRVMLFRRRQSLSSPGIDTKLTMLSDCGAVSKKTLGWPNQVFYEIGFPPFNTRFFA
jgi:hypothetical protein